MISIDVPGWGKRTIEHVVCDFNGTLALDGHLLPGVDERLAKLSIQVRVHICSADLHGNLANELKCIDANLELIKGPGQDRAKVEFIRRLGPMKVVAIGNGSNDALMVAEATLGIAVLGPEGAASATIQNAKIVCADINQALDLLVTPARLVATLQR